MAKQLKLQTGNLLKIKQKDFNILDEENGKLTPFCVQLINKEDCEICFENELEYIKHFLETPYNYIDLNVNMLLMYICEDSFLSGKNSQEYFQQQLWTNWHKFLLENKIIYIPEQFLTNYYMKIIG